MKYLKQLISVCAFVLVINGIVPNNVHANSSESLTLLIDTRQMYHNNQVKYSQTAHKITDGVTYGSLRSLAEHYGFTVFYDSVKKEYGIRNGTLEILFLIENPNYYVNGQKETHSNGQPYIAEGNLMIPVRSFAHATNLSIVSNLSERKVKLLGTVGDLPDSSIVDNQLFADFRTDKESYKIGEPVIFYDLSTYAGSEIIERNWFNREDAYFTPGKHTITLEVKNRSGEVNSTTRTILVSDEILHTREQFKLLQANIGEIIPINGSKVLDYQTIPYLIQDEEFPLIRANSPESIRQEGIYYSDDIQGSVRVQVHKQNSRNSPVKIYLIARNNNSTTAEVKIDNLGIAGPSPYVLFTGRHSVGQYLENSKTKSNKSVIIEPGESKIVVEELSEKSLEQNQIITMYADLYSDSTLNYQIVVLDSMNSLNETLPLLTDVIVERDGMHSRGTFNHGNRTITIEQMLGNKERVVFGDSKYDSFVTGIDKMTSTSEVNYGNRAVVYNVKLAKVAPNTAILLNARGGNYSGAFQINNQVVYTPETGTLKNQNDAVVLYRTGQTEESINIKFIPASGSNLPINLLFEPLVER